MELVVVDGRKEKGRKRKIGPCCNGIGGRSVSYIGIAVLVDSAGGRKSGS